MVMVIFIVMVIVTVMVMIISIVIVTITVALQVACSLCKIVCEYGFHFTVFGSRLPFIDDQCPLLKVLGFKPSTNHVVHQLKIPGSMKMSKQPSLPPTTSSINPAFNQPSLQPT